MCKAYGLLAIYVISLLGVCWFLFMAVHELGHIVAALMTGGTISRLILHPFTISQTDLSTNPYPLIVVWTGPVVGAFLPLAVWLVSKKFCVRYRENQWLQHLQFFAGFCLIANGAYIGLGSFERIGDCIQMLKHGTPIEVLWAFGIICVTAGFYVWHRLGSVSIFLAQPDPPSRLLFSTIIGTAGILILFGLAT